MGKNLKGRAIVIVAVVVACIIGIIGFPKSIGPREKLAQ